MKGRFIFAAALLQVAVASRVQAEAGSLQMGGHSLLLSFLQMLLALAAVIGVILLVYYGATRLLRMVPAARQTGRHIRIVEIRPLGPRKSLLLVEVSGEYLLLAHTDSQLSLIKQIDMLEEIEVLDQADKAATFRSLLDRFRTTSPHN